MVKDESIRTMTESEKEHALMLLKLKARCEGLELDIDDWVCYGGNFVMNGSDALVSGERKWCHHNLFYSMVFSNQKTNQTVGMIVAGDLRDADVETDAHPFQVGPDFPFQEYSSLRSIISAPQPSPELGSVQHNSKRKQRQRRIRFQNKG